METNMTEIYLCDNEPSWSELLEQILSDYMVISDWALAIVCKSVLPDDLLTHLSQSKTLGGIYFLDIELKSYPALYRQLLPFYYKR